MENKLIKDYFRILGGKKENEKEFYILENKKSGRSIIFQKRNKNAIKFMKNKSSSSIKKLGYLLIRLGVFQIFLKKVKLDSSIGQLVFYGGQTKIFNFDKKKVISFIAWNNPREKFVKNKKDQEELSKKDFAPKIFKLNKKIPFCEEELLKGGLNIKKQDIFKKLIKYYESQRKKKISYFSYIQKLERKNLFKKLPKILKEELKRIKNKKKKFFYVTNVHGDFGRSQLLLKGKEIVFTDWNLREDLLLADLFSFFKGSPNIFKGREFWELLNLFPKDVKENVKDYFFVNQVNLFLSSLIPYYAMIKQIKGSFLTPKNHSR